MTDQTISSLPPPEEVYANLCIKIINLPLHRCPSVEGVETTLNITSVLDGTTKPVITTLYTIDDKVVGEYLPSRVWFAGEDGVTLLYYVSPSLPNQVRPFKDGKSYALVIPMDNIMDTVDYNAELRLLIDQVETPSGISYVLMFADDVYDKIVI